MVTVSRLKPYNNAKRLAFNLTSQEIRPGNIVQKANLPMFGNNKKKSDDDLGQPHRSKQDSGKIYVATVPSPTPFRQYA